MMELPKVFRSCLEAAAEADKLRAEGDNRPLEIKPLSNGQAVLREYKGEQNDNIRTD